MGARLNVAGAYIIFTVKYLHHLSYSHWKVFFFKRDIIAIKVETLSHLDMHKEWKICLYKNFVSW